MDKFQFTTRSQNLFHNKWIVMSSLNAPHLLPFPYLLSQKIDTFTISFLWNIFYLFELEKIIILHANDGWNGKIIISKIIQ